MQFNTWNQCTWKRLKVAQFVMFCGVDVDFFPSCSLNSKYSVNIVFAMRNIPFFQTLYSISYFGINIPHLEEVEQLNVHWKQHWMEFGTCKYEFWSNLQSTQKWNMQNNMRNVVYRYMFFRKMRKRSKYFWMLGDGHDIQISFLIEYLWICPNLTPQTN